MSSISPVGASTGSVHTQKSLRRHLGPCDENEVVGEERITIDCIHQSVHNVTAFPAFVKQQLTNQWHTAAIGAKLWRKEAATLHSQVPVIIPSKPMNEQCMPAPKATNVVHLLFPQGRKALYGSLPSTHLSTTRSFHTLHQPCFCCLRATYEQNVQDVCECVHLQKILFARIMKIKKGEAIPFQMTRLPSISSLAHRMQN